MTQETTAGSLDRVRHTYEELGKQDPFWAVLTDDKKRGNKWDSHEFFETGRSEIEGLMEQLHSMGLSLGRERALDFGCGVGRLSQALCSYFECVVGVDISRTMIEKAEQLNQYPSRCTYVTNTQDDLSTFNNDAFDLVYSNITLQHMPPRHSLKYIGEFIRVLKPDGLAVFHVPDGPDYTTSWWRHRWYTLRREYMRPLWKQVRGRPPVQIHYVPQKKVEGIITASKGTLLHTLEMRPGRGHIRTMWYFAIRVGCCEIRKQRGRAYKKDE